MEIKPVRNQLRIDKKGGIFIFTDVETGKKWYSTMPWIRAMIFGSRMFYYANKYIPLPEGRPKKQP